MQKYTVTYRAEIDAESEQQAADIARSAIGRGDCQFLVSYQRGCLAGSTPINYRRQTPPWGNLLPQWCVTLEVRTRGAIGKFAHQEFLVNAASRQPAFDAAFQAARDKGLETRFGVKAERYDGE